MTGQDFFQTPEAQAILRRAAVCAAVPAGLHDISPDGEEVRVAGFGQCAACRYVNGTAAGREACRASRAGAARIAALRGSPLTFVCHLGLGCVSVPALPGEKDAGPVLTFGPFYASEEPRGLLQSVEEGLAQLGLRYDGQFKLDDVRIVPSAAVPETAAWAVEALDALWKNCRGRNELEEGGAPENESAPSAERPRRVSPAAPAIPGADIAVALAGGNQTQGRALLRAALEEASGKTRPRIGARRARMLATVSSALEAAEGAGMNTAACWEHVAGLAREVREARTDDALMTAGMRVLGALRREAQRPQTSPHELLELNKLVMARFPGKITLNDIAQEIGQHPTAITHRLQRKFGMSFSEYIGHLRMDKAKELLRKTRLSAGDVAVRVGINDASNFSKVFRKMEGMSPLEYRERFGRKA